MHDDLKQWIDEQIDKSLRETDGRELILVHLNEYLGDAGVD